VIGVKYTTARRVAQLAVDRILAKLGIDSLPCRTEQVPVYGGEPEKPVKRADDSSEQGDPALSSIEERLSKIHGSRAGHVALAFKERPSWAERVCPDAELLTGEVLYSVREEMALKLGDVVFRRTGIGTAACPAIEVLRATARIMAGELGWTDERQREEVEEVLRAYEPLQLH
jgi:glycerol-3-phosphate dehydrogenase